MLSTSRNTPGAYTSVLHGATSIYRSEGLYGFYRGLTPSLFGVSHGAIQFMAYEKLKIWRMTMLDPEHAQNTATSANAGTRNRPKKVELSNWDFLTLSALSKVFAGSITYPYQVVRARLQTYDALTKYKGAGDVVKQVWKGEGLAGFYKGYILFSLSYCPSNNSHSLGPNIVRVLPSTCVTFLVYENTKIYLPRFYANHEDDTDVATSRTS